VIIWHIWYTWGKVVTDRNDIVVKCKSRLYSGNACCHQVPNIFLFSPKQPKYYFTQTPWPFHVSLKLADSVELTMSSNSSSTQVCTCSWKNKRSRSSVSDTKPTLYSFIGDEVLFSVVDQSSEFMSIHCLKLTFLVLFSINTLWSKLSSFAGVRQCLSMLKKTKLRAVAHKSQALVVIELLGMRFCEFR